MKQESKRISIDVELFHNLIERFKMMPSGSFSMMEQQQLLNAIHVSVKEIDDKGVEINPNQDEVKEKNKKN